MDKDQAQPVKRTGLFGWLLRLKTLLVVFSMVGLVASNIAAVLHAGFYDLLMMGIQKAALIVGSQAAEQIASRSKKAEVDKHVRKETATLRSKAEHADAERLAAESDLKAEKANHKQTTDDLKAERANLKQTKTDLQAERANLKQTTSELQEERANLKQTTAELQQERAKLKQTTADLETERTNLKQTTTDLQAERANLKKVSSELDGVSGRITKMKPALQTRLAKGVSRNLAAIPAESIPYVGVGVVLAVTAADLKDACDTMKDFNTLLVELGRGEKDPDFCGRKVPSKEEVWSDVKKNAKGTYQRAKDELDKVQIKVPEFSWPTLGDFCLKGIPGC